MEDTRFLNQSLMMSLIRAFNFQKNVCYFTVTSVVSLVLNVLNDQ